MLTEYFLNLKLSVSFNMTLSYSYVKFEESRALLTHENGLETYFETDEIKRFEALDSI